jgi:hypothetical protein
MPPNDLIMDAAAAMATALQGMNGGGGSDSRDSTQSPHAAKRRKGTGGSTAAAAAAAAAALASADSDYEVGTVLRLAVQACTAGVLVLQAVLQR